MRKPPPETPAPVVAERKTPLWGRVAIGAVVVVLIAAAVYAISREPEFGDQPDDERDVVQLIEDAREEYDDADHDLQRDAALRERDKEICQIIRGGRAENWTGKVFEIESNHDGEGMIGINIEPMTQVTTRNNAFSGGDTLIELGSDLHDQITELEIGQVVTFSGTFIADDEDKTCFTNPRFTQGQRIARPLMLFKFDEVSDKVRNE